MEIKINSLASVIPKTVFTSLFVDDLQIAYQDHRIINISLKLQLNTINKIAGWATRHGFRFSKTKTVCMKFFNQSKPNLNPTLKLQGHPIPAVQSTKFLGPHLDSNLTWEIHIEKLKQKCRVVLNIMRTIFESS